MANPIFQADLKKDQLLSLGTGVDTFARNSVATVFDNTGKLVTAAIGAPRFGGARMLENQIDNTVLPVVITGTGTVSLASGVFTLDNSASGSLTLYRYSKACIPGNQYRATAQIRRTSGSGSFSFDINDVLPVGATPTLNVWTTVTTNVATASGTGRWLDLQPAANTIYEVKEIQLENVTGLADQSMSPYFVGAQWLTTAVSGSAIPEATLKGYRNEPAATNSLLWCRDLTNAAWVKTSITAALTQVGIDDAANAASILTATGANATCLQTLTLAAAARTFAAHVKRVTGTGTISITRDGGSTWTDVTSQINSSTFTRVKILNTSVLNPQVGFKISTSGDAIAVDYCQDEAGATATSEILTTTAAVTRVADTLTYPTAGNFSDTAGTIICTKYYDDWGNASGFHVGKTGSGMIASSLNSGVIAQDGTNTVNGTAGTPSGKVRMAISWSGSTMKVCVGGVITTGSYDGSFNLATIGIGGGGYIKDVLIYNETKTDQELIDLTTESLSKNLTGQSLTQSLGNLTNTISSSITGQSASISTGALETAALKSLSGFNVDVQQGNVYAFVGFDLDGFGLIVQRGSLSKARTMDAHYNVDMTLPTYSIGMTI